MGKESRPGGEERRRQCWEEMKKRRGGRRHDEEGKGTRRRTEKGTTWGSKGDQVTGRIPGGEGRAWTWKKERGEDKKTRWGRSGNYGEDGGGLVVTVRGPVGEGEEWG